MAVSVDTRRLKLTNDEGTEGVLLGFRCLDCGIHVFGPATFCQGCSSSNLSPVELGKEGILYSYTIVRVPPQGWPGDVPYVLGQIELGEGPQVLAEVIDCPEDNLKNRHAGGAYASISGSRRGRVRASGLQMEAGPKLVG